MGAREPGTLFWYAERTFSGLVLELEFKTSKLESN